MGQRALASLFPHRPSDLGYSLITPDSPIFTVCAGGTHMRSLILFVCLTGCALADLGGEVGYLNKTRGDYGAAHSQETDK